MSEIFSSYDLLSLAWFVFVIAAYELFSAYGPIHEKSIGAAVQKQRDAWMLRMSERDVRIMDAQLLGWLVNANAFFASTTVITLGGLGALLGYGDMARTMIESLPYAVKDQPALWELKVIFLMAIMTFAFFKFAWAFRLSHYTVMMVGATPAYDSPDSAARIDHAHRTAQLLGLVGSHSNYGLRSFYYTIAGLMWFYHPFAFMAATTWVMLILLRRDYMSHSRSILRGDRAVGP